MYLTLLEDAILRKFFEIHKISCSFLDDMKAVKREFTENGFVTDLNIIVKDTLSTSDNFKICAKINEGELETSYSISVVGQKVCRLEGFTCGEDWPELIEDFDVYASSIH